MPVRMAPLATDVVPTKDVRPDEFVASGPFEEHFSILVYFEEATNEAARKTATKTTVQGNGRQPLEEFDRKVYVRELIKAQLKGWRLLAPPEAPDADVETQDGQRLWKFKPEIIARLPWDLNSFLYDEIQRCGGIIPTKPLIVKSESGQVLDFRRAYALLGEEPGSGEPVSE